ncbi:MAG: tRNA glutamyl-Q(34) synthetase GluQRS [Mariprofundaceae bacterium]
MKTNNPLEHRTRFAPSPTGYLHIGNAYSALACHQWAKQNQGELLLRIEDIDHARCHQHFAEAIIEDLRWLGVDWQHDIIYQSQRFDRYQQALEQLIATGAIYPCYCSRKQIRQEIERIAIAPHADGEAPHYPGNCRNLSKRQQAEKSISHPHAWRLDINKALKIIDKPLFWHEEDRGMQQVSATEHDDVIVGRKDIIFSYHLTVVIDDADQQITDVIRGEDLVPSTGIHRILQALLKLSTPTYHHHPLLCDHKGERYAKRHHAPTLRQLRLNGDSPTVLIERLQKDPPAKR